MKTLSQPSMLQMKYVAFVAYATLAVLLVPLIAMQFTNEVAWTLSDFIIAGALLFTTGVLFLLISSRVATRQNKLIVGFVLLAILATIWAELAVGLLD